MGRMFEATITRSTKEAVSAVLDLCDGCGAIHVLLLDKNDNVIAQGAIAPEDFDREVKRIGAERLRRSVSDGIGKPLGHG